MYRLFFSLLGILFVACSILRAQQLQVTTFAGLSPAAEISFIQTAAEANLGSKASPVFEIGLDYYQKIYRRWGLLAGVYGGVQSHSMEVEVTPAFLGTTWSPDLKHIEFAFPHFGARLLADYRVLDKGRHRLSASAGIGAFHITRYFVGLKAYITPEGEPFQGNDRAYYTDIAFSDSSKKIRLRPEFRLNWQYALGKKTALHVFVAGAYTDFAFQNATFNFTGESETAYGTWLTRFQQTGIGVGICRRW